MNQRKVNSARPFLAKRRFDSLSSFVDSCAMCVCVCIVLVTCHVDRVMRGSFPRVRVCVGGVFVRLSSPPPHLL